MLTVFGLSILLIMTCRALNWSGDVSKILFIFSGLSGVLLILSMSGIYMISTIPAWNGFYTPFSFICSALVLGTIGMMVYLNFVNPSVISESYHKQSILILLILVLLIFIGSGIHQYQLSKLEFTGIEQMEFKKGAYFLVFIIRMVVLLIVISGFVYLLQGSANLSFNTSEFRILLIMVSSLILIEEIIGRYLFYSSFFRVGV